MAPSGAVAAGALTFSQVRDLALGEVGRTLAQVKADFAVTGEWASYNYEWCAWFVTWLLRNNGIGYETGAQDPYDTYVRMGRVGTTPTVGSLIFFDIPASHVGLVIGTNGSSCETVEGNAGSNPWPSSVVHHNYGRVGSRYAYPVYAGYDSMTGVGNPSAPPATDPNVSYEEGKVMYIRRAATGEIAVFGSDYRSATGASTGRHMFSTAAEYNRWRDLAAFYNSEIDRLGLDARGKKFVPPAITDVMGVGEADWGYICGLYGV